MESAFSITHIVIHKRTQMSFFLTVRWRHNKKDEATGKAERRKETNEENRKSGCPSRGIPCCSKKMTVVQQNHLPEEENMPQMTQVLTLVLTVV